MFKQFFVSLVFVVSSLIASNSFAQANLDIDSPAVSAIRKSMAERTDKIKPHFASGAVGFTQDGMVALRDANTVPLPQRAGVNSLVAEDNKDRAALYKEIARANGKPDWEEDIRKTFAQTWVKKAPAGWYYQDDKGAWQKK
jgi:uncharacterized protein